MRKLHRLVATSTAAALMRLTCGATYALAEPDHGSKPDAGAAKKAEAKKSDRDGGSLPNDPDAADPTTYSEDKSQSVTSVLSAEDMAKALVGHGITITDAKYTGNKRSAGTFKGFDKAVGINSGVALTTGQLDGEDYRTSSVLGPNSGQASNNADAAGDARLSKIAGDDTYDASILEFSFKPTGSKIRFSYVFGSEEYPDYVGKDFNDVFALDVNGENCGLIPGTDAPVTINNVNAGKNSGYFVENYGSHEGDHYTQLNGFTKVLKCNATVKPGEQNTIRLAIADTADQIYDSAVLIKASSVEVQEPPTAKNVSYFSYQQPVKIALNGDDINPADTLTYNVASQPAHGKISGTTDKNGKGLTYTPDDGYGGTDSFSYLVNDGTDDSNVATVKINNKKNSAPEFTDDSYSTEYQTKLEVDKGDGVLANDTDVDSEQTLTVPDYEQPKHGKVTVAKDGSFAYVPDAGFSGKDSFKYSLSDGIQTIDPVATITVKPNDPPNGKADSYQTPFETKLKVKQGKGLLANDTDPDKDAFTVIKHTKPEHGKVKIDDNGSFVYTPAAGWSGKDSFTYRIGDGFFTTKRIDVTVKVGKGSAAGNGSEPSDNGPSSTGKDSDSLSKDAESKKDADSLAADAESEAQAAANGGTTSVTGSGESSDGLASTGSDLNPTTLAVGIGSLIAGLGVIVAARKLRR